MATKPPTLANRTAQPSRTSTTRWGHLYRRSRWRRASEAFRATPEGALCAFCLAEGKITPSELVDHIQEHHGDERLFWDRANWRGCCWSHHSARHRAEQHGGQMRVKGCDQYGAPLDQSHHWHRASDA